MKFRSKLVRSFRALIPDGRRSRIAIKRERNISLSELAKEALDSLPTMTVDDCHSILVSISKILKTKNPEKLFLRSQNIHPVHLAPLAQGLLMSVLSLERAVSFRTRAGVFGLIHRLGIDWDKHVTGTQKERLRNHAREVLPVILEHHMTLPEKEYIDATSLSYCCEAAVQLDLISKEFTKEVLKRFIADPCSFPPLATIQVAELISHDPDADEVFWDTMSERILANPGSFTVQNFVKMLQVLSSVEYRNTALLEVSCHSIRTNMSRMRLTDCISVSQSAAILADDNFSRETLYDFIRAVQRRATILIVTSHVSIPETLLLSSTFRKLSTLIPPSSRDRIVPIQNSLYRLLVP